MKRCKARTYQATERNESTMQSIAGGKKNGHKLLWANEPALAPTGYNHNLSAGVAFAATSRVVQFPSHLYARCR